MTATTEFKREIHMRGAYDKRETGHGVHGVDIMFSVSKNGKGVEFTLYTGWYLHGPIGSVFPAFVSYHDSKPHYEDQHCSKNCSITGRECYSGGSVLLAEEYYKALKEGGSDLVFQKLEALYVEWLGE